MIKIRLQRHGARHAPFYRMVVTPSTTRRDGKFIEVLGTYNPKAHVRTEELKLKMERIDHWLGVGAQPTDTAKSLIRQGRLTPEEWLEKSEREAAKRLGRAQKGSVTPSMEAKPVDEKPTEESKKEEAKAPVEEKAKEEKPAVKEEEVKPVDEKPTEESKKEEAKAPVEEKAKEEKPAVKEEEEAKPADEKPAEEPKKEVAKAPEKGKAEETTKVDNIEKEEAKEG